MRRFQCRMDEAVPAAAAQSSRVTPWYRQLWFLVLVAMAAGVTLGQFYPDIGARMEPLGNAFIKAIRVLIAPIIFCTGSCTALPAWPTWPRSAASRSRR